MTDKINKTFSKQNSTLTQNESQSEATCQKEKGINCQGCCESPIFSSNVFTCCEPNNCTDRIQLQAVFEGLGNITIERFPKGNYGVWYGDKNLDFGTRQYVGAEQISNNIYKFIVGGREYHFTVTEFGCGISTIQNTKIINQTTINQTGSLFVESEPTNSSLYLDDMFKGLTPIIVADLISGIYEVKLSKEGFRDSVASWSIIAGETKNLSITLKPLILINQTNETIFFNQTQPTNFSIFVIER